MKTLAQSLSEQVREGELYEQLDRLRVRCYACGHNCPIPEGFSGACKVRYNRGGKLFVPWGYVSSVQLDPVEKKPFYHALPGSTAMSFGMLGCNLHCGYCQNWITSQALKDFRSSLDFRTVQPEQIAQLAVEHGAASVISTYNEPLITSEWAAAVFRYAKQAGLRTGYVSNGEATPQVLEYLRPVVDFYKVDLKTIDKRRYIELGGRVNALLDSVKRIHDLGFWLELVTLVVPGYNDSAEELTAMAEFIAGISPDIPWHLTPFHPDYKFSDRPWTSEETLGRAAAIARGAGLRYVYTRSSEDTKCPNCRAALVRRSGFRILENRLNGCGRCPECGQGIPGVWPDLTRPVPDLDLLVHGRCG
jgi:pyruvate formate lyase activating enzyme